MISSAALGSWAPNIVYLLLHAEGFTAKCWPPHHGMVSVQSQLSVTHLRRCVREGGALEALGNLPPQRRGVADAAERHRVLRHALDAKGVVHGADRHHQHVVWHLPAERVLESV